MDHEHYIGRCYELAQQAVDEGNHPFGALLVNDGEIVAEAVNTVVTGQDVTGHAELNLIRAVGGSKDLSGATLYTSTEPCAMCSGAIYWAGIAHVVFGVSGADLGQIAGETFVWSSTELFSRGTRAIKVHGPVNAVTGRQLHQSFWPSLNSD